MIHTDLKVTIQNKSFDKASRVIDAQVNSRKKSRIEHTQRIWLPHSPLCTLNWQLEKGLFDNIRPFKDSYQYFIQRHGEFRIYQHWKEYQHQCFSCFVLGFSFPKVQNSSYSACNKQFASLSPFWNSGRDEFFLKVINSSHPFHWWNNEVGDLRASVVGLLLQAVLLLVVVSKESGVLILLVVLLVSDLRTVGVGDGHILLLIHCKVGLSRWLLWGNTGRC